MSSLIPITRGLVKVQRPKTVTCLKTQVKTVQKNGRIFCNLIRNFASASPATHRVVYIYQTAQEKNREISPVLKKDKEDLLNLFSRHTSKLLQIGNRELEEVSKNPEKAVLVINEDDLIKLEAELDHLVPTIRKLIKKGDWNYFGSDCGAVFAGFGLKSDNDGPRKIRKSFLRLANFRDGGFPYFKSKELSEYKLGTPPICIKCNNTHKFNVNSYSGPSLEIVNRSEISEAVGNFRIFSVGKYYEDFYGKALGKAILKGFSGVGKFYVHTHLPIEDRIDPMDGLSESIRQISIEDGIKYVTNDSEKP